MQIGDIVECIGDFHDHLEFMLGCKLPKKFITLDIEKTSEDEELITFGILKEVGSWSSTRFKKVNGYTFSPDTIRALKDALKEKEISPRETQNG